MNKRIILKIDGMECPNCAMILEGIEDRLCGIKTAEASYRKAQLIVEYDESKLTEEKIIQEVERLGYKAS